MADYQILKEAVAAVIKNNGNQEITGDLLQTTLFSMINTLGTGYQFAGVADGAVIPGTPDAKLFYIAKGPGIYENFNNLVVNRGELAIFFIPEGYGSWYKMAAKVGDSGGYKLYDATIYAYGSLPARPTDGGYYFLFADRISGNVKYRYIFTSSPDVDEGNWTMLTTAFRIALASGESSSVGQTPISASSQNVNARISDALKERRLIYNGYGSASTWEGLMSTIQAVTQEGEDLDFIEQIAMSGIGAPVAISLDSGESFGYLTYRNYTQAGYWVLRFGDYAEMGYNNDGYYIHEL